MGCGSSKDQPLHYTLNGKPIKDAKWTKHENKTFPIEIVMSIFGYANIQCRARHKNMYSQGDKILICGYCHQCRSYQFLYKVFPNFDYQAYSNYLLQKGIDCFHLCDYDLFWLAASPDLKRSVFRFDKMCGDDENWFLTTYSPLNRLRDEESRFYNQIRVKLFFCSAPESNHQALNQLICSPTAEPDHQIQNELISSPTAEPKKVMYWI